MTRAHSQCTACVCGVCAVGAGPFAVWYTHERWHNLVLKNHKGKVRFDTTFREMKASVNANARRPCVFGADRRATALLDSLHPRTRRPPACCPQAIYVSGSVRNMTLVNTTLTRNVARGGGAIAVYR